MEAIFTFALEVLAAGIKGDKGKHLTADGFHPGTDQREADIKRKRGWVGCDSPG